MRCLNDRSGPPIWASTRSAGLCFECFATTSTRWALHIPQRGEGSLLKIAAHTSASVRRRRTFGGLRRVQRPAATDVLHDSREDVDICPPRRGNRPPADTRKPACTYERTRGRLLNHAPGCLAKRSFRYAPRAAVLPICVPRTISMSRGRTSILTMRVETIFPPSSLHDTKAGATGTPVSGISFPAFGWFRVRCATQGYLLETTGADDRR